jgi:hypothetical protein
MAEGVMRVVAMLTAAVLLTATTARAQSYDRPADNEHRVWKVLIGTGALITGTVVAAKSSNSTKTTGALGVNETSEFSKSQLITGLAVAGTGGFLLWDGLHDRHPDRPSTRFGVGIGPKSSRLIVQRRW